METHKIKFKHLEKLGKDELTIEILKLSREEKKELINEIKRFGEETDNNASVVEVTEFYLKEGL